MNHITSILVPTDFSACSRVALDHAAHIADRFGAAVGVLHVWQPSPMRWSDVALPPLTDFAQSSAGDLMKSYLDELERRGIEAHGRLAIGEPWRTIVEVADSGPYDLIAMGSSGGTALAHLVVRSVPERVARRARCPVLIVRAREPVEVSGVAATVPDEVDVRFD